MRVPQSPAAGCIIETRIWNGKKQSLIFFFCNSPLFYLCVFLAAINFSPTFLLDPSFFLLWSEFCHYMLYGFLCLNYYSYAWLLSVFLQSSVIRISYFWSPVQQFLFFSFFLLTCEHSDTLHTLKMYSFKSSSMPIILTTSGYSWTFPLTPFPQLMKIKLLIFM